MRYSLTMSIGILLLAQANVVAAQTPPATYGSVYENIYNQEKNKFSSNVTSDSIAVFIPKILPDDMLSIQAADVDNALRLQRDSICVPEKNNGNQVTEGKCTQTMVTADKLAKNNAWLQATLEDLQVAASSYEIATNPYGGGPTAVIARLPGITSIWKNGADILNSPFVEQRVRAGVYPGNTDTLVENIGNALQALIIQNPETDKVNKEKFVAAVWRYQHGVLSLGSGCSQSNQGDGTELQFVTARFCNVEQALTAMHNQLPKQFTPPLRNNELVVYPIKNIPDMPVLLWVREDDIGLMWQAATDPILPSMNCDSSYSYNQPSVICNSNGAILGGFYPAEIQDPELGEGLCSHPSAKNGYLCRKILHNNCTDSQNSTNDILLTECNSPDIYSAPISYTDSGPNVCGVGGWQDETTPLPNDTPSIDDEIKSTACSNCAADLLCANCPPGTFAKEENGKIIACVDQDAAGLAHFEVLAALTMAQQQCNAPAGENSIWMQKYNTISGCCAAEYQSYKVACNALAETSPEIFGEEFDVTSCAVLFANNSCEEVFGAGGGTSPGEGICGDTHIDLPAKQAIDSLKQYLTDNADRLGIPASCNDAVQNISQDAQNIKHSMPLVCSPECEANYINTIGNNACYIGACVEESAEANRLMPGRVTWKVQDPSFYMDHERKEVPAVNSNALFPPIRPNIPVYKPLTYVQSLDKALCQSNGLPALTPPALCAFDERRRTSLPGHTPDFFAYDISQQLATVQSTQATLHSLTSGIGARLGAVLYAQYFENAMLSLREIITDANTLLHDLETTSFPTEMCPQNML